MTVTITAGANPLAANPFAVNVAAPVWIGSNTLGTKRAGMNTYDQLAPGQATMLQYDFDNGVAAQSSMGGNGLGINNANPLTNEAFTAPGDSGGPGLILNPGTNTLQIGGVHSRNFAQNSPPDINNYINPAGNRVADSSYGEVGGQTLANAYSAAFINPIVNASYDLVLDMNFQVVGQVPGARSFRVLFGQTK
jgi:hypothetical protein